MNYRHAYHAGNFADVLKHAVLALVITHLKLKDAPFRIIDTHAGAGLYDLTSVEAGKTLEWQAGIGRLMGPQAPALPDEVAALLEPYLTAVRDLNPDGKLSRYPGSPRLALTLMRPQDRLIANELNAGEAAALTASLGKDRRAKVLQLDAWIALKSLLPPRERRGAILIDPPFEQRDDFERLPEGLAEATRRFATGSYLLWHPIKDMRRVVQLRQAVAERFSNALSVELLVRHPSDPDTLSGCGLLALNPPHTLEPALATLLPFLAERLAQGDGFSGSVARLRV